MQVGHFPASAASSLIQGYCDDFVSLATILAQTLEQVSMRGISLEHSRQPLQRIEKGMRDLADAIRDMLDRGQPATPTAAAPAKEGKASPAPGYSPVAAMSSAAPPMPAQAHAPQHAAAHAPSQANQGPPQRPAGQRPSQPAAAPATPQRPAAPTAPARAATTAHAPPSRVAPTRPAPRAEALRGTSQSMPLLSVFQFIGRMRKAGTMRVRIGGENLVFELQNGCVLVATSDNCLPDERLGALLVEHAACTMEQLAPIIAKVDAGATERFGQLAIQAGLVRTEQVLAVLEVQARRRFTRACKSPDAAYEFVEEARPAAEPVFRIPPMQIC